MLITKEVEVVLHARTTKYYESLGYEIPRVKINNKYVVKKGTTIIIKVRDLLPLSNVIIEYECDYCGTSKKIAYSDYTRKNNKDNKDWCIDCLGEYRSEVSKELWKEKNKLTVKSCSKCKREFPKTTEYFRQDNHRPDGLTCQCKECADNKEIFGIEKETIPEGSKKCIDCNNIFEINESNFKTYVKSKDGFYNICVKCQIARRHKDSMDGHKRCKICNRELSINRDFYDIDDSCLDGYRNICRECNGEDFYPKFKAEPWNQQDIDIIIENYETKFTKDIQPMLTTVRTEKAILHIAGKLDLRKNDNYIKDYKKIQYKLIDNQLCKLCKCCEEYLPVNRLYFPDDQTCTDNLRNVCRVCKGEKYLFDSNVHLWSDDEVKIMINNYSNMTNTEIKNTYFPDLTIGKIMSKGNNLNLYKSKETLDRMFIELGKMTSERLLSLERWRGKDNPQFDSHRFGNLNPNYRGGISELSQELRRNVKQWKLDSMENANYKCFLSESRFDDIHHLYSFESIVKDTLNETNLPIYGNISLYTQEELQLLIDKCLEIHYRYPLGICMQKKYHIQFHVEFGYGNNTPDQFYEFITNYYDGKYKDLEKVV